MSSIRFDYKNFLGSADVQTMTAIEFRAYTLLLLNSIDQKNPGFLPDDEEVLRKLSKMSKTKWAASKHKILKKFQKSDKGYYNLKMLRTIQEDNNEQAQPVPNSAGNVHGLQQYVFEKFPDIRKMKYQLTYRECEALSSKYSVELIKAKLRAMQNTVGIEKKSSVYLTLLHWIQKDIITRK